VVADVADVARGVAGAPFGIPTARLEKLNRAPMQRHEGGYYIRLAAVDRPGTAAKIATRMAENNISLESIVQRRRGAARGGEKAGLSEQPAPVILITYATTEDAVRQALQTIDADGVLAAPPQVIRIETR
jgi:homoserine dehydrogenase